MNTAHIYMNFSSCFTHPEYTYSFRFNPQQIEIYTPSHIEKNQLNAGFFRSDFD